MDTCSGDDSTHAEAQAQELVSRLARVQGQQEKWKVVTVQLGGNDICSNSCAGGKDASPEAYKVISRVQVSVC